ncbi:MAG: arsenate reductase family protein [Planctomycetota bacterium]
MSDDAATKEEAKPEPKDVGMLIINRGWAESVAIQSELEKKNVTFRVRDVFDRPLLREELEALFEGEESLRPFLNSRAHEFRDSGMGERTPPSDMAIELILRSPSLLELPILVHGDKVIVAQSPKHLVETLQEMGLIEKPKKKVRPVRKAAKKAAAKKAPAKKAAAAKKDADKPAAAKKD